MASSARLARALARCPPIRVSKPGEVIAARLQELIVSDVLRPADRVIRLLTPGVITSSLADDACGEGVVTGRWRSTRRCSTRSAGGIPWRPAPPC